MSISVSFTNACEFIDERMNYKKKESIFYPEKNNVTFIILSILVLWPIPLTCIGTEGYARFSDTKELIAVIWLIMLSLFAESFFVLIAILGHIVIKEDVLI